MLRPDSTHTTLVHITRRASLETRAKCLQVTVKVQVFVLPKKLGIPFSSLAMKISRVSWAPRGPRDSNSAPQNVPKSVTKLSCFTLSPERFL